MKINFSTLQKGEINPTLTNLTVNITCHYNNQPFWLSSLFHSKINYFEFKNYISPTDYPIKYYFLYCFFFKKCLKAFIIEDIWYIFAVRWSVSLAYSLKIKLPTSLDHYFSSMFNKNMYVLCAYSILNIWTPEFFLFWKKYQISPSLQII